MGEEELINLVNSDVACWLIGEGPGARVATRLSLDQWIPIDSQLLLQLKQNDVSHAAGISGRIHSYQTRLSPLIRCCVTMAATMFDMTGVFHSRIKWMCRTIVLRQPVERIVLYCTLWFLSLRRISRRVPTVMPSNSLDIVAYKYSTIACQRNSILGELERSPTSSGNRRVRYCSTMPCHRRYWDLVQSTNAQCSRIVCVDSSLA